eukprot:m.123706 g.123706  ORF g.123706 m.123706 type:complete len:70 (+) comp19709_c0_seq6:506-715(+)
MGGCVSWLKGLFKPKQKQVVFRRMRHEEDSEDENVEITTTLLTKEEMDEVCCFLGVCFRWRYALLQDGF